MPDDMESLARRVEAGSGADAELTEDIARALGWVRYGQSKWWRNPGDNASWQYLPRWLESLDAAASLALPGWRIAACEQMPDGDFHFVVSDTGCKRFAHSIATTEPRARTAAWLRARAAAQPATGEK